MSNQSNTPQYWDEMAGIFDDEPDHGLHNPAVRKEWRNQLGEWVGAGQANVLDIGCGTGSLSLLLFRMGYRVMGADWSPAMLARARSKTAAVGMPISFFVMDATEPALTAGCFDVVLCRHLLWALPDPTQVLQSWARLLVPDGRLILIEGYWHTGGGLHAGEIVKALPPSLTDVHVQDLSRLPRLWGREINDERYCVIAQYLSK